MIVVVHQTMGMAKPVVVSIYFSKDFEKFYAVPIIFLNRLSRVSTCGDMIDCSIILYSYRPSHTSDIAYFHHNSIMKDMPLNL
jgi:hypothetical protein